MFAPGFSGLAGSASDFGRAGVGVKSENQANLSGKWKLNTSNSRIGVGSLVRNTTKYRVSRLFRKFPGESQETESAKDGENHREEAG